MNDKKIIWAWVIGVGIFALIVGVWAWRLPHSLARLAGKDPSLAFVLSSYGEAKDELSPSFSELTAELDENMQKFRNAVDSQKAKDDAVNKLKQDLAEEAARQKIKAAMDADAQPAQNP